MAPAIHNKSKGQIDYTQMNARMIIGHCKGLLKAPCFSISLLIICSPCVAVFILSIVRGRNDVEDRFLLIFYSIFSSASCHILYPEVTVNVVFHCLLLFYTSSIRLKFYCTKAGGGT